ncbi:MAG: HNH endonuclease [Armatimonadota bacterium]|nr:HNH endonuclease [Armatimonadota bacterium]
MDGQVLVLNQNYEPLSVCGWQRAVSMVYVGKAIVVEEGSRVLHSPSTEMNMPTVVKLSYQVKRPIPKLKMSRQNVLARDRHTCQYCGRRSKSLTIDHVIPRERGGTHTWENVVACCSDCNNKKKNRTPREAGMRLIRRPRRPKFIPYLSYATFRAAVKNPAWRYYLEPFAPHLVGS